MNLCECGHNPADHYAQTGACEAEIETLWGAESCTCPRYNYQGDN